MDGITFLRRGLILCIAFITLFPSLSCVDNSPTGPEYIDENSNLRRGIWTTASPPFPKQQPALFRFNWYNPYDPVAITDIWPDSSVDSNENAQTVLILDYTLLDITDLDSSSWCGIMRPIDEFDDSLDYIENIERLLSNP